MTTENNSDSNNENTVKVAIKEPIKVHHTVSIESIDNPDNNTIETTGDHAISTDTDNNESMNQDIEEIENTDENNNNNKNNDNNNNDSVTTSTTTPTDQEPVIYISSDESGDEEMISEDSDMEEFFDSEEEEEIDMGEDEEYNNELMFFYLEEIMRFNGKLAGAIESTQNNLLDDMRGLRLFYEYVKRTFRTIKNFPTMDDNQRNHA